jgi:hypothetical protein
LADEALILGVQMSGAPHEEAEPLWPPKLPSSVSALTRRSTFSREREKGRRLKVQCGFAITVLKQAPLLLG